MSRHVRKYRRRRRWRRLSDWERAVIAGRAERTGRWLAGLREGGA